LLVMLWYPCPLFWWLLLLIGSWCATDTVSTGLGLVRMCWNVQ
jgi:hypothetical protein